MFFFFFGKTSILAQGHIAQGENDHENAEKEHRRDEIPLDVAGVHAAEN
jgi:hypothetical protein